MVGNIKGITIEIGGDTTKLDKALSAVNKQTRSLQTELRDVNKLLKLDPTNTTLLAQKQEILKESIAATSEKLDVLRKAEAQVQKQFEKGEVSEEQYRALQREIEKTSLELGDLQEAAKQTDKAMDSLKSSSKLTGEELDAAQEKADSFKEELKDLGEKGAAAAAALGAAFVAAATYAVNFESECDKALNTVITQTGAAESEVAGLEETLLSIYNGGYGEDINDVALAMSQVKQQTGLANEELQTTTQTALLMRDTFDIDVNEGIRGVNAMMKQFGISAEEAYNLMAQGAQKGLNQNGDLADQMAEYAGYYAQMGFSAEEMFNMIANGAKDGTFQIDYLNDAVKEFGIRVKDGTADDTFKELGLDAAALKEQFAAGGESARAAFETVNNALFACDDEVQRNILGVTLYGTKWEDLGEDAIKALTNTNGEIANTSDALSTINETKYDDLGSQIEELGRNINTELVKPIGEELQPVISDVIKEVKEKIPQAKAVVLAVVEKTKEFISFVVNNGPTIISIIAGIAAGMLAWNVVNMIQGLIAAFKVWKATTEGMTLAQQILNTVMAANPIGIVITVVAALVAALVTLFATNEDFRNKVIAVWEKVKEVAMNVFGSIADFFTVTLPAAFNKVVEFVKSNWQGLLLLLVNPFAGAFKLLYDNCEGFRETIDELVQNIIEFFSNLWANIEEIFSGVGAWFKARFTEAYKNVTTAFKNIGQWFGNRWREVTTALSNVGEWFRNMFSKAYNGIVSIFQNIGKWFSDRWTDIKTALANVATWYITMWTNAYNGIVNVFKNIGQWFGARWTDVKNAFSTVATWFGTQFQNAWTNIKNAFSSVGTFFSGLWTTIKNCFVDVGTKIGSAVGDAFKKAINSCLSTIENIINKFIGMINGVIDIINEIPGVELGSISKVSLPRLAKGGVLREGSAIMAEAGPELISMVNGRAIVTPLTSTAKNTALEGAGAAGHGGFVQNNNYYSPKALSPSECARQTRNATRNMILQLQGGT